MNKSFYRKLLEKVNNKIIANSIYFKIDNVTRFNDELSKLIHDIDSIVIIPFYITEKGVYEIYDYELDILFNSGAEVDSLILEKTGKSNINDIDTAILNKLRNCIYVINPFDKASLIIALKKYFEFLDKDKEFKERIPESMGVFEKDNLYFEIY